MSIIDNTYQILQGSYLANEAKLTEDPWALIALTLGQYAIPEIIKYRQLWQQNKLNLATQNIKAGSASADDIQRFEKYSNKVILSYKKSIPDIINKLDYTNQDLRNEAFRLYSGGENLYSTINELMPSFDETLFKVLQLNDAISFHKLQLQNALSLQLTDYLNLTPQQRASLNFSFDYNKAANIELPGGTYAYNKAKSEFLLVQNPYKLNAKSNVSNVSSGSTTASQQNFSSTGEMLTNINNTKIEVPTLSLDNNANSEGINGLKLDTPTTSSETSNSLSTLSNLNTTLKTMGAGVAGMAGSYLTGMGTSALGKALNTQDWSKAGLFGFNIGSSAISTTAGSAVSGAVNAAMHGTNIGRGMADGIKSAFSSSGSALTGLGAAAANIALDTFDPVKKAKWENYANLGIGLVGLIPGFGTAAAAAALAFNGIGHLTGHKLGSFTADLDLLSLSGMSYGGTKNLVNTAQSEANTKFSGYNTGAFNKAYNRQIDAKLQQWGLNNILADSNRKLEASKNNLEFNNLNWNLDRGGGYLLNVSYGKLGMILERTRQILSGQSDESIIAEPEFDYNEAMQYIYNRFPITKNLNFELLYDNSFNPKLDISEDLGNIEYWQAKHNTLPYYNNREKPENLKGKSVVVFNNDATYEDIALDVLSHGLREQDPEYNKLLEQLKQDRTFRILAEEDYLLSKYPLDESKNPNIKDYEALSSKLKNKFFKDFWNNKEDVDKHIDGLIRAMLVKPEERMARGYGYRDEDFKAMSESPVWQKIQAYIRDKQIDEFKEGGIIELTEQEPSVISLTISEEYKQIDEFKEGGSINVIPEGALHARKHNMDLDGITKKGIPVVDNDGVLQAEIEREEVIFRLELTLELEKLYKIYYNNDSSNKEKEEAALNAGKLLTTEILHNTIDNTNNLI